MRELLAAVLFLAAAANGLAGEPAAPRQRELMHLLKQDCGSCHGLTMKGGLGPALLPANLAAREDATLVEAIVDGRPGTAMPPWRFAMSADEALWLVDALRKGLPDAP
jgi:cytochrome c55X